MPRNQQSPARSDDYPSAPPLFRSIDIEADNDELDRSMDPRRPPRTLRAVGGVSSTEDETDISLDVRDRLLENFHSALAVDTCGDVELQDALLDVEVEEVLDKAVGDIVLEIDRGVALFEEREEVEARLQSSPAPASLYQRAGKRAFDILVVLALAPLWLPLYCLTAVFLLLFQGRPLYYRAMRPGRDCKDFSILKFRTMHTDAHDQLENLLRRRPELAEEFSKHNKLKDDPRRTRLGSLLRKTSLDELPQLFNVLKGDMSIVGPRPPATRGEYDTFYGLMAHYIFQHRPGLTGLWQISERSLTRYERKIWFDMIYARRCSFLLDLSILMRTIPSVLRGHGAY